MYATRYTKTTNCTRKADFDALLCLVNIMINFVVFERFRFYDRLRLHV